MANVLLNGQHVAFEAMALLRNEPMPEIVDLVTANGRGGFRLHDTVNVRIPTPFDPNRPISLLQPVTTYRTALLVREVYYCPLYTRDLLLPMDRFAEEYGLRTWANLTARTLARNAQIVVAEQELPMGLEWSERIQEPSKKLSIRCCAAYDVQANQRRLYLDLLYGVVTR